MFKEVYEQLQVISDMLVGCIQMGEVDVNFDGFDFDVGILCKVIIVVCGILWYVGLVGKYMIECFVWILVEVDFVFEFCYCELIIGEGDLVVVIFQLGEIVDILVVF